MASGLYEGIASQTSLNTIRDISALIRAQRKNLHLTQSDLAQRLGTTQDRISRLENGSPRVEVSFVLDALKELGFSFFAELNDQDQEDEEDPFLGAFG